MWKLGYFHASESACIIKERKTAVHVKDFLQTIHFNVSGDLDLTHDLDYVSNIKNHDYGHRTYHRRFTPIFEKSPQFFERKGENFR
jgi:hypothetical protein